MTHAALLAAILAIASPDRVDPEALATAIESETRSPDWAAILLTVAKHESALSAHIAAGECLAWQCDPHHERDGSVTHLAFGLYQTHRNALNASTWGTPDIAVQTKEAARMLHSAYWTCARLVHIDKANPETWVPLVFDGFAGKRCGSTWAGGAERMRSWRQIRGRL